MMWHFYEIPYIPDLELVKYQSLGEQGIDGILERHNRFLRQWQRNTVLIHTTLHFFLSYTHERPKGSRLQIFLAFSSDQTVNFESIDALMQASPLADYYKIAPIEDVPVCLRKSFTNILLVKKQEQTRLSTGDTLFTVEGWKSNPKSRLYEMEKNAEALNEDMQKNSLQINTMKVPILLRMSKLQFTGTKKLQIRVVSMQCIKQATSTTLCQLTIIKLDSGSLLQRKKAIRMLKMYCATI